MSTIPYIRSCECGAAPPVIRGPVYDVRSYWARGDGTTDDHAAIVTAMTAAAAAGGGIVEFGPTAYRILARLEVPSGVGLRGVAGSTVLDFSGLDHFENGTTSGLILASGSLGVPVALTRPARRTVPIVYRLQSATRSGTTVTGETDMPHGFEVGDPVWITGNPASAGQGVFFSINRAVGGSARTMPFLVASIVDATRFTYIVPNTGDTSLSGIAFCNFASDVVLVADTSGFTAGQDVMIRSAAYRTSASLAEQNHLGEFGKIARVVSPTMILLHADVQDDYLVSDTAEIVPVAFHRGFSAEGIGIIGKGPNTASGYGDRGIVAYLCEAPRIERCKVTAVDQMGIYVWSCLGGSVNDNLLSFDASDEAGFVSGGLDIQYGIVYGGCTSGLKITGNHVYGGRHAIVQSMSSTPVYHGVARNISIAGNTLRGQWLASIATHQGVDGLAIVANLVAGSQGGINPRYSRDVVMSLNVITAYGYGIYAYNYIGNFTASGNTIRAGQWGIRVGREVDVASVYGPLKIVGNNCEGGEYGIYVFDGTAGIVAIDLDISGNTTRGTKYAGIRISLGDDTASGDGWYGRANGNTIIDAGLLGGGGQSGMQLTNFRGGQANGNSFRGSAALDYALNITGAGTANRLELMGNSSAPGLLAVGPIRADSGFWHRTDMPEIAVSTGRVIIAAGIATPRFARSLIVIDAETFATDPTTGDDLDGMALGTVGQVVTLRIVTSGRPITVRDNAAVGAGIGAFQLAGSASRLLDSTRDTLVVECDGLSWNELSFASN